MHGNHHHVGPIKDRGALLTLSKSQDEAIKEHASRLEAAEHFSKQLERKQETLVKDRIESVRRHPHSHPSMPRLTHACLQSLSEADKQPYKISCFNVSLQSHQGC